MSELVVTELALLKETARTMGISFHPSCGVTALKTKIAEHKEATQGIVAVIDPSQESIPQRNARMRKEAQKLVRVRITNMNPNKREHPGEIISVSNSAIGVIKKMIPFKDAEEGYHIPLVLLGILRERKFQSFYTVKLQDGTKVKRSRLSREFAIEVLPDLTYDELKELSDRQALEGSIE